MSRSRRRRPATATLLRTDTQTDRSLSTGTLATPAATLATTGGGHAVAFVVGEDIRPMIGNGGWLIGNGVEPGQNGGWLIGNGATGAPGQKGGNGGC